mgnify:CR=1 FL=1
MDSNKDVQHVYLVGAKSLGAYGGYETFVYKLTEYHQNKENIKYHDAEEIPVTAMINPTWRKISNETDIQYEGCLSVPSIRGKVERYKDIELTYYDENGKQITRQLHGFFARLVQHECDHLEGIVFLDRVKEKNGFATIDNINKYNLREK